MFMFNPLPLASVAGLQPAAGGLDGFMPWAGYAPLDSLGVLSVVQGGVGPVLGLHQHLRRLGDTEALFLLDEAYRLWGSNRGSVAAAVKAQTARQQLQFRRQKRIDTAEERKQLRAWSQQTEQLVPPATQVADRAASWINDAAQGVGTPTVVTERAYPSWA